MDRKEAIKAAEKLLDKLIEHQPNFLQFTPHSEGDGKFLASFCKDFIDEHASYLEKRPG